MTLGEVLKFSDPKGEYAAYSKKAVGKTATPMGRYQIVGQTLRNLMKIPSLNLKSTDKFSGPLQDKLFEYLATNALIGKSTPEQKRTALRNVWEGLIHTTDKELDDAINSLNP
jgi:muramidase (phage lysozyme)